jgi:hypothetical protein
MYFCLAVFKHLYPFKMDNLLLSKMLLHADPSQVTGLSRFFKTGKGQYGEGDKFLGIKVPVTREVVKECWQSVGREELEECIGSEYHEVRLAALLSLVEIFKHCDKKSGLRTKNGSVRGKLSQIRTQDYEPSRGMAQVPVTNPLDEFFSKEECIKFYLNHTDSINNWDLVDLSCYPLLGEWLLDKDRSLLYKLARYGKTIWEQRIGIVSTMTFIRHGQLDDTFAISDILLYHPHDLIHKAVGWLLREAGKKDKLRLEAYLQGVYVIKGDCNGDSDKPDQSRQLSQLPDDRLVRYRTMPRTMLRYAIEKFPETERQAYLSGKV